MQQLTRESALPNHLQLSLFVPLPLPAPGLAPEYGVLNSYEETFVSLHII